MINDKCFIRTNKPISSSDQSQSSLVNSFIRSMMPSYDGENPLNREDRRGLQEGLLEAWRDVMEAFNVQNNEEEEVEDFEEFE